MEKEIDFEALKKRIAVTDDIDEVMDILNLMNEILGQPPAVMSDDFANHCIALYENSRIKENQ